jgi:hypothetical protein
VNVKPVKNVLQKSSVKNQIVVEHLANSNAKNAMSGGVRVVCLYGSVGIVRGSSIKIDSPFFVYKVLSGGTPTPTPTPSYLDK